MTGENIQYAKPVHGVPLVKVQSLIPSITEISKIKPVVTMLTYYQGNVSFQTVRAFIALETGQNGGVSYGAGELVIVMVGYPEKIDYTLDADGHLVVHATDAERYQIDEDGYLIYT